jgi:hypothetical protein
MAASHILRCMSTYAAFTFENLFAADFIFQKYIQKKGKFINNQVYMKLMLASKADTGEVLIAQRVHPLTFSVTKSTPDF